MTKARRDAGWFCRLVMPVLVVVSACSGRADPPLDGAVELTVGAAVSVAGVMAEIVEVFAEQHPGVKVRLQCAASGVLLHQLEQGAPIDVVVFADRATTEAAAGRGVFLGGMRPVARNRLLLAVPKGNPAGVRNAADLVSPGVSTVCAGNPDYVPLGRYARDALTALGLWEGVSEKRILAGSAAQAREYVRGSKVDAAILYGTDVRLLAEAASTVEDLTHLAGPVYVAAVVLRDGKARQGAAAFLEYLATETAQRLFRRRGFSAPAESPP